MDNTDIELGTEPIEVERKARAGVVISARFSAEEADAIQALAESRQVSLSRLVRDAVTAFVTSGGHPFTFASSWTGTNTNFGSLNLAYARMGPIIETAGEAREIERIRPH